MRRVLVIGAGFAGVAAAVAARAEGAEVRVLGTAVGASSSWPGACDDEPWDERERAAGLVGAALLMPAIDAEERALLEALGLRVPEAGAPLPLVAATSGRLRSTLAHDRALLDLGRCEGRVVLVPRASRAAWDADALVLALTEEAARRGLDVELAVCELPVLRYDDERRAYDADIAARHDEAARRDWLVERLGPGIERVGRGQAALLLGPWLGLERERASELEARFGVPVGEALAATASTVGIRFEGARAVLLAREGIELIEGRATRVLASSRRLRAELAGADALEADAVVLATGGLAGGGIVYQPAEYGAGPEGAEASRSPFRLSLELAGSLVAVEGARRSVGSMFGPDLGALAWPRPAAPGALERVGVITRGTEIVPRVHAAGDVVAGEPRTVLRALRSGLAAGRAAARSIVEA